MRPFIGTEAVAAGAVNRYQLATRFQRVHRNVYAAKGLQLNAVDKAQAAWLWSGRRAILAGCSAAALHGARWIDPRLPAELNQTSQHKTAGIMLHCDTLGADDIVTIGGIPVTSAARTAFDVGRRRGLIVAVTRLDALMRATGVTAAEVYELAANHHGARGVVQLRKAVALADAAAESPQETRVRLVLTKAGLPPEGTQIDVFDSEGYHVGRIDMGWRTWKVGVEYDGQQHWTDPGQRAGDIDRQARLEAQGWRIIHVSAEMLRTHPTTIVVRVWQALHAAAHRFLRRI
jgi:hypothetical protein